MYEIVYNSSESNKALKYIKTKIRELVHDDEVGKITSHIVKQVACKMKPKKGGVTGEYTSDAILNAPDILFKLLANVFRSWLVHGTRTVSLLACAFLQLLKKLSEKSCRCFFIQSDSSGVISSRVIPCSFETDLGTAPHSAPGL